MSDPWAEFRTPSPAQPPAPRGGGVLTVPVPSQARRDSDLQERNTDSQIGSRAVSDVNTQANTERTQLEISELERQAQQLGLTPLQYSTYRDNALQLPQLAGTIETLRNMYERDFRGVNLLEYGPLRSVNQEFDSTAMTLSSLIAAAQNLTGQMVNQPPEAERYLDSFIPRASDKDAVIERKLNNLNALVENASARAAAYGFRFPARAGVPEAAGAADNWRFSPEESQQARDIMLSDASPEEAARRIIELTYRSKGLEPNVTDQQVADYARVVTETRAEMSRPGALWGGFRYDTPQANGEPAAQQPGGLLNAFMGGVGDVVEGAVGGTLGLLANPLNAGLNLTGLPQLILGEPLGTDLGGSAREALNLPRTEGVVGEINRGVAGVLTPAGLIRTGANFASRSAPRLADIVTGAAAPRTSGQAVARSFAATPVTDSAVAAAGGTAAELVRQEGGGPAAQFFAAMAAGAPAAATGRATRFATEPGGTGVLAENAARENISLMPADAGGAVTRSATAGANLLPLSAGPLEEAADRAVQSVERAVTRNVDALGGPLATPAAGESVATASGRLVSSTMQEAGNRLDGLAQAAGDFRPPATRALEFINARIDRLNAMPESNAAEIAELERLAGDLRLGVGLQGLRDLRTDLRSGISFDGRIRTSTVRNFNKQLSRLIGEDIEAGLEAAGNTEALARYREFNSFYSERAESMDALARVVGTDRSGEQIVAGIRNMAGGRGNERNLRTTMSNLTPEEANGLRATVIDGLGKARPDADFDMGIFVRNWQSMPRNAREALFGDGPVLESLNRIASVAGEMAATQRYASNPSGTARGMVGIAGPAMVAAPLVNYGADGVLAAMNNTPNEGSFTTALVLSGLIAGGQRMYGNLLSNERFAQWLSRAPRTSDPLAVRDYAARLTTIAAQEPQIASDIENLRASMEQGLPTQREDENRRNQGVLTE